MSGTIGITAHHVPGVRAVRRAISVRLHAVRARGGLSLPFALPVALALTAGSTWAIMTFAERISSTLSAVQW
jgi:hypothetical protein